MGPKLQKERLRQIEDVKTVQREKQQEILDEKRNPQKGVFVILKSEEIEFNENFRSSKKSI